jgi:hypothetical protein
MKKKIDKALILDFAVDELTELAEQLTWNSGVRVIPEGASFYAVLKEKKIYIPGIMIQQPELKAALIGGVYHEAGHINWTRPFPPGLTGLHCFCINVFEDIRIEERLDKYHKARPHLEKLYKWALQDLKVLKSPSENIGDLLHKLLSSIIVISRGYISRDDLPADVREKFDQYSDLVGKPTTWEDVLALADQIMDRIKNDPDFQQEQVEHQQEEQMNQQTLDQIEGEKEAQKEMREKLREIARGDERHRMLEKILKQIKSQVKDLIGRDPDTQNQREKLRHRIDSYKEKLREQELKNGMAEIKEEIRSSQATVKDLKNSLPVHEHIELFKKPLEDALHDELFHGSPVQWESRILPDEKIRAHVPWTKKHDRWFEIHRVNPPVLAEMQEQAQPYIEHLSAFLGRFLRNPIKERPMRGLRRGKLDRQRLWRYQSYQSPYVWKESEIQTVRDTAVSIMVDQSTSMYGRSMDTARLLAYILSRVMEDFKVSNEVVSFAASSLDKKDIIRNRLQIPPQFCRPDYRLVHNLYKGFDRTDSDSISMADIYLNTGSHWPKYQKNDDGTFINEMFDSQNVDNESIVEVARRLLGRKEARKILFVISDGFPCCPGCSVQTMVQDLRVKVRELERIGVEVVAFGIRPDHGRGIYPNYIQVDHIEDLLQAGVEQFKKVLIPRTMRRMVG